MCDLILCCHDGNIVSSLNPEIFIIIHLKLSCLRIIDELNFMRLKSSTLWKLEILYLSLEHSLYNPCFQPPPYDVLVSRSLIEASAKESSSHVFRLQSLVLVSRWSTLPLRFTGLGILDLLGQTSPLDSLEIH